MFHIIGLILIGLVVGALGRLFHPGRDKMGLLMTMVIGVASVLIAGLLIHGFLGFVIAVVIGVVLVALWARLAPAAGDDWFLSSINFDETKQYVRKVMNSYKRYTEIYGNAGPVGGVRAEP